jgi:hypothetical protein
MARKPKPLDHSMRAQIRERHTRLPSEAKAPANRTEAQFAAWARNEGWRTTKRGWPDFLCNRDDQLMAVEVKGGSDYLRPEQRDALTALNRIGMPTFVWSPENSLVPYPSEVTSGSTAALEMYIDELHSRLRDVIAERDELRAVPMRDYNHVLSAAERKMQRAAPLHAVPPPKRTIDYQSPPRLTKEERIRLWADPKAWAQRQDAKAKAREASHDAALILLHPKAHKP